MTTGELYRMFDEFLDELGSVDIGGISYDYSDVLKRVDEVRYHQDFNNYIDSLAQDGVFTEEELGL